MKLRALRDGWAASFHWNGVVQMGFLCLLEVLMAALYFMSSPPNFLSKQQLCYTLNYAVLDFGTCEELVMRVGVTQCLG